jgi:hypothetical protein
MLAMVVTLTEVTEDLAIVATVVTVAMAIHMADMDMDMADMADSMDLHMGTADFTDQHMEAFTDHDTALVMDPTMDTDLHEADGYCETFYFSMYHLLPYL